MGILRRADRRDTLESEMRWLLIGLMIAVAVYAISGGHLLFLPLLFLPLGGIFGGRRRRL